MLTARLNQFFESLDDEEESEGDVSTFINPEVSLFEVCYNDFQKITGFTVPFAELKPWSTKGSLLYKRLETLKGVDDSYDDDDWEYPGLECTITNTTTDRLTAAVTEIRLRVLLNMEMNYSRSTRHDRGDSVNAEVEIFLVYCLLDKVVPLAKYKRTAKGMQRTWIHKGLTK